jgi:two-component system, cell cycle sensor histidine kinase and response regulator CckA
MDRPLRILHLEDDVSDAELVHATLTEADLPSEVLRVDSRVAFEAAVRAGGFDLVLSDFSLPAFNGTAALRLVRELSPETPFILVSGTIGEDAAIEGLLGGATDYVPKQRLARLVPAVRRALVETDDRRARLRAEEARAASETRYRRLFESAADGILILDGVTEQILDANPSFLSLFGYTRSEVVGCTVTELELTGHDQRCEAAFREVTSHDEGHFSDLRLQGREGKAVDADVVSKAYTVEGQRVVQCSIRDIRERRRLESQLLLSQKMEAVGQLAGGVAHDFNNLLVVINSYTELAVANLQPTDPMREDLEQVAEAGARAAALTRQLLAFSRRQLLQPVLLSLGVVVGGLEKMLRRLINEDIELRIRVAEGLGSVRADPTQMEQVILNLVLNARDAMPRGGTLTLETSNATVNEADPAGHPEAKPGEYVLLSVTDTGCGMDEKTQGRIFEPFFTTKALGKGTGLGLATVYGIVKQSGGYISVDSEVDRGSRFRIYLPRERTRATDAESSKRPAPTGGTETILVVEDDDSIRRLIQRVLKPAGYTVLTAPSGEAALKLCEQRGGPVHLLLTDVVMPSMSGSAVAAKVAEARPGVRVLYMSGYLDEAVGVSVLALDFIHKPFTASGLLARVREALDRK